MHHCSMLYVAIDFVKLPSEVMREVVVVFSERGQLCNVVVNYIVAIRLCRQVGEGDGK